ncbi:IS66-like element accessory protein TnpA [Limimaricola cinnabarinus]|uniref:Transposase n=1 Tax=Limimaricola cinnabarinus TaxID=1125964 RepID=A0A2G1MJC0_9RHOB|nr:transposase [Limimaricola cinnabarinus]PHP28720.1 hypothetical protein CJ301_04585 [Limimaricola cinnabarinus]
MSDGFAGRYEVLEDRATGRRTWPTDAKLRIVAESHAPGAMVSEVARRHRLMPSQVTTWRRLHREGKLGSAPVATSPAFVPLMLDEPGSEAASLWPMPEPEAAPFKRIEIEAGGGVVIRLAPSTPAMRIAEIAVALREARS